MSVIGILAVDAAHKINNWIIIIIIIIIISATKNVAELLQLWGSSNTNTHTTNVK
jgi:hypothetical protein